MFSSGCRRGILALAAGGGFNPLTLFASGEQGGWWDPSDFTTMFQDSAGTTPVTAAGQPVGLIRDKSGRGNHRTQATAGSRPTLQQDASGYYYLSYDGVDDFMLTGSVDFSATNKLTAFYGINKQSDVTGIICELSTDQSANNGAFVLYADTKYNFGLRETVAQEVSPSGAFLAPDPAVLSAALDLTAGTQLTRTLARRNGVALTLTVLTGPTTVSGNLGNYPLYFGRRGGTTFPFSGREYGIVLVGRAATVGETALGERFIGSRMGIAL